MQRRWNHVVFLELRRDSRVMTGISGFLLGWSWEAQSSPLVRGKAGGCARVTAGPKRPHLGVCPGPNIPLQGRQGSRGCIPGSSGESGLVSRGIKDSALLSSRDAGLWEPPERPQGSPASSSVWRQDPGLLCRPCSKRRPSAREDGGISGVSSSCGARGGFLPRHYENLREPLVWRQGSQVSIRWRWGSSHGSRVTGGV